MCEEQNSDCAPGKVIHMKARKIKHDAIQYMIKSGHKVQVERGSVCNLHWRCWNVWDT